MSRYEILGFLGQGGFGYVYKARQLNTEQEVAIKLLRPPPGNDAQQLKKQFARFRREMRICSRLYHPNIVSPIDSGQTEGGLLYSVFEFVPGRTLAEVLAQEGALDPQEALRLMSQLLDALDCAHRHGVIHRDIKPHNIMLSDTGARRNALMLDFGLSTLCDEFRSEVEPSLTSIHEILGTPAYAAPEQLRGFPPNMRSDLYSWGLVLLECLTGERVMKARSFQEVLRKQLEPEPLPLPEALEGLRLGELLRQVVEKDVDKREVTAGGLLRELEVCDREEMGMVARRFALAKARSEGASRKPATRGSLQTEGQLRQITVLCCDVSVPPAQVAHLSDIEEQDRALRNQQRRCIEIVEEFGGYLGTVLGRQLMFYFGYPSVQEDAPRCASRAALRLLDEVASQNPLQEAMPGGQVGVRIGIHTGMVVIRDPFAEEARHLPSVLGPTPAIASHHQDMAELGEALVSHDAYRLLRNDFAFESVQRPERISSRYVDLYRLSQERPVDRSLADIPLIGREQELHLLIHRWALVRQGVGQALLIAGEPGIGKSRLLRELCQAVRDSPHTQLEVRCAPEARSSALHPIINLMEQLLGHGRHRASESDLEALLAPHGFELKEAVPLFASLLSIPLTERYPPLQATPEWQKAITFEAVVDLLVEMTTQQPVLLVIEDLHWADPTTLEFLTFLLDVVPTVRLGIILTARCCFSPPWSGTQVGQIQLGRFEPKQAEELIAQCAGHQAIPPQVRDQVIQRSDGVPLFIEELTRAVLESEVLEAHAEGASRLSAPSGLTVPPTLRNLLMARLDRLGRAKETAQLAAALGREFSHEQLRVVCPRGESALQADLDALVGASLLYRRRGLKRPAYMFRHALLRDMAYESMLRPARSQVHARIAAALEQHFPEVAQTRPDLLASHHAAAGQRLQAVSYFQRAAQGALLRSANLEAIQHAREGLGLLDALANAHERAETELTLHGILTPALMATRGWGDDEIKVQVERAQALIDRLGDNRHTTPTLWALTMYHHIRGHRLEARSLAERILTAAERSSDIPLQLAALPMLGECLWTEGRFQAAVGMYERALALYDPHQHQAHAYTNSLDARAWAQMSLGTSLTLMGRYDQGLEHAQASLRWAQALNHSNSLAVVYLYLMITYQLRGDRERLVELSRPALELMERHGMPMLKLSCHVLRAWALRDAEALEQNLTTLGAQGNEHARSYYLALQAETSAALGRYDTALAQVEATLMREQTAQERFYVPELLRLKGLYLRASGAGSQEASEACWREAVTLARQQGSRLLELRAATSLCQPLAGSGRSVEARTRLAAAMSGFTEGRDVEDVQRAQELLEHL